MPDEGPARAVSAEVRPLFCAVQTVSQNALSVAIRAQEKFIFLFFGTTVPPPSSSSRRLTDNTHWKASSHIGGLVTLVAGVHA